MIYLRNLFTKNYRIKKEKYHYYIKSALSLRSSTISDRILERYIVAMLTISSIWLFDISIFNTSLKAILFLFITLMTAAAYSMLLSKGQIVPRTWVSKLDKWMLGVFVLNVIVMFMKILSKDYGQKVYYEVELVALILVMAYFILSCATKSYRYYLILLPVSAIIVYLGILVHFLWLPEFVKPLALLVSSPQNLTAYAILIGTVSSLLYCTAYGKPQSVFYMVMSGISFFILFLSSNMIGICLVGVLFLLIPVIFVPTAELIKRDMHLFFLYFFLLSNMSLVTNYTGWVKVELTFDIMTSIYIDLALAVIAVCYLQYWEKIPENIDTRCSIMKKLQKAYSFMLKIAGISFLVILLAGEKLTWIKQTWGIAGLQNFVSKFQQCYLNNKGTAFDILGEYGIIGFVLFLIIAAIVIKSLRWKYHKEDVQGTMLAVIAMVYLVQSLFLGQQLVTTPIYVILLILALFHKQEKKGENL